MDWATCDEPPDPEQGVASPTQATTDPDETSCGIAKRVQALLASVRTDLDSFSDVEAYALMLSGYRMTESEFVRRLPHFPPSTIASVAPRWRFLALSDVVDPTA